MMTTMRFAATATCPKDGEQIKMAVEIVTQRFILVETVLAAAGVISASPVFQEDFTRQLAEALGRDVTVTTRGTHSGVDITCSA